MTTANLRTQYRIFLTLLLVGVLSASRVFAQPLDMEKLKGLAFRSIGPAGMS